MATAGFQSGGSGRLSEIDVLRGLVIVLMALDHVRDYTHSLAFAFDPLDAGRTTPLIYATRWITHLCAPTFVLLAGVSSWLQLERGKTKRALSWLLFTRGLWLIALELTVLSFGWSFGFPYLLFMQVIWAIGWSMIILAGLVWAPRLVVLALGVAIMTGHNLLDSVAAEQFGAAGMMWTALHEGGPVFADGRPLALFAYPILPWAGMMAFGYGLGRVFSAPAAKRDRMLLALGVAMLAFFFVLRGFNLYGDAGVAGRAGPFGALIPWREQPTVTAMIMAFLNVQKYPPSLMYALVTLGAVFTMWPLLARLRGPVAAVLATFGAAPFLFYVVHIYLVHLIAIAANAVMGRDVGGMFNYLVNVFVAPEKLQGLGFSLPYVYGLWVLVVALLYPLCAKWAALKRTRRDWWLSYL